MGFEAALHHGYANNSEERAALQVLEGRASRLLFPLLGRAASSSILAASSSAVVLGLCYFATRGEKTDVMSSLFRDGAVTKVN